MQYSRGKWDELSGKEEGPGGKFADNQFEIRKYL
jgi:hypothetical protein